MTLSTAVVLAARPTGRPSAEHFRIEQRTLPEIRENEVLLRTVYLSLDPYMRGRMNESKSYATPVPIGGIMEGGTVSEVIDTRSPRFRTGDLVFSKSGWQTHAVMAAEELRPIDPRLAPITTALGVLGMPGFAAYLGLTEIGKPKPGETLVVAAATGPVGSAVAQIAGLLGARVVCIAGGARKVDWLKAQGFDAVIDHRSASFEEDLAAAVPNGIDVYFENVGGQVWEAVLGHLNDFARVPVCGLVAHYNETETLAGHSRMPQLMTAINVKRLLIQGFTQRDFGEEHRARFEEDMGRWFAEGKIRYKEDIVEGIERAPEAFIGMLNGDNFGKLIVRVSEEPMALGKGADAI
ncbi:NADP-dependent oxidoreductase [Leucobacter sp. GX24907]